MSRETNKKMEKNPEIENLLFEVEILIFTTIYISAKQESIKINMKDFLEKAYQKKEFELGFGFIKTVLFQLKIGRNTLLQTDITQNYKSISFLEDEIPKLKNSLEKEIKIAIKQFIELHLG